MQPYNPSKTKLSTSIVKKQTNKRDNVIKGSRLLGFSRSKQVMKPPQYPKGLAKKTPNFTI